MTLKDHQAQIEFEVWHYLAKYAKRRMLFAMRREMGKTSLLLVGLPGVVAQPDEPDEEHLADLAHEIVMMFRDHDRNTDYVTLLKEEGVRMWPGFPSYSPKAAPNHSTTTLGAVDG